MMNRTTFLTLLLATSLIVPLMTVSSKQQQQRSIKGTVSVQDGVTLPTTLFFIPLKTEGGAGEARQRIEADVDSATGKFSAEIPDDGEYMVIAYPPCYKASDLKLDKQADNVALKFEWANGQALTSRPGSTMTTRDFGLKIGGTGLGNWKLLNMQMELRYKMTTRYSPGGSVLASGVSCDSLKGKTDAPKN
ncbi:MAG: hypothetical protein ACREEM_01685 [Blastocatellia bacterium]